MPHIVAADVDRLFLQALLSRSVVSLKLARVLLDKSIDIVNASNPELRLPKTKDDNELRQAITRLNVELDKLEIEVSYVKDEVSGTDMLAIANKKDDDIAKAATDYTPVEIAFFRAIVEQIMLAPKESFAIWSSAALGEIKVNKLSLTFAQGENLLTSFVSRGWLLPSQTKKGLYTLSIKSLAELGPYLQANYPDEVRKCFACDKLLTRGYACPSNECKGRIHDPCYKIWQKGQKKCKECNTPLPPNPDGLRHIGEDAAPDSKHVRRRVRVREVSDEEGEEGDEPEATQASYVEDDEETQAPTQTQTQKQTKKKKGKKAHFDDDEDEDMDVDDEAGPSTQTQRRRSSRR